ncbi:hypothetical protein LCGC14_3017910, partial [marine sediment metagenome]
MLYMNDMELARLSGFLGEDVSN